MVRSIGVWVAVVSSGVLGCRPGDDGTRTEAARVAAVRAAFPAGRAEAAGGHVSRLFGASLATGATPGEAAERFRQGVAPALGAQAGEIVPQDQDGRPAAAGGVPRGVGLMYDRTTGQPKFWLFRYAQTKGGVPVHRGGLSTLVRNGGGNPVVWAASSVHDLGTFAVNARMQA